jgi:hypothetical protein
VSNSSLTLSISQTSDNVPLSFLFGSYFSQNTINALVLSTDTKTNRNLMINQQDTSVFVSGVLSVNLNPFTNFLSIIAYLETTALTVVPNLYLSASYIGTYSTGMNLSNNSFWNYQPYQICLNTSCNNIPFATSSTYWDDAGFLYLNVSFSPTFNKKFLIQNQTSPSSLLVNDPLSYFGSLGFQSIQNSQYFINSISLSQNISLSAFLPGDMVTSFPNLVFGLQGIKCQVNSTTFVWAKIIERPNRLKWSSFRAMLATLAWNDVWIDTVLQNPSLTILVGLGISSSLLEIECNMIEQLQLWNLSTNFASLTQVLNSSTSSNQDSLNLLSQQLTSNITLLGQTLNSTSASSQQTLTTLFQSLSSTLTQQL